MNGQEHPIFTDWTDQNAHDWGEKPLCLKHRLDKDPLFSEDMLADLIDRYPRPLYDIIYMGEQGKRHLWRNGERGNLSGRQIIDAIRNGRFWINLQKLPDVDARYGDLLKSIFAEIEDRVPSLGQTYKHSMGLLISSPKAQVYYHCDIPGQSLWQIAGSKRVYVYPTTEKYMPQEAMETVILGETEEEIAYHPSFDEGAQVFDLQPGEMLTWPLNGPHRVMNHDSMNISVTTEHWTDEIRNSYGVHFANGVLRRLGVTGLAHKTSGPMLYPKLGLAAAYRSLGLHNRKKHQKMVDFRVDPSRPEGFVDIDAYPKPA